MCLGIAGAELAAFRVPTDDVSHRLADVHQAVGIAEQLEVAAIPRDDAHLRIDDADALSHVLHRRLQQPAAEAQFL